MLAMCSGLILMKMSDLEVLILCAWRFLEGVTLGMVMAFVEMVL